MLLPAIGVMDFANYDRWESGDPPCKDGTDSCWTMVEFNISSALGTQLIETRVGTAQTPPVPWQLLWVLDWGWFILLGMTVIFLPDSPPLKVRRAPPPRAPPHSPSITEHPPLRASPPAGTCRFPPGAPAPRRPLIADLAGDLRAGHAQRGGDREGR